MSSIKKWTCAAAVIAVLAVIPIPSLGGQYLVIGSGGPGFATPEETLKVLERVVIPTFDVLEKLKAEKKILAGGLPVGERTFVFILQAASNGEADQIIRELPLWPYLEWKVTPLQSVAERAKKERMVVEQIKKGRK